MTKHVPLEVKYQTEVPPTPLEIRSARQDAGLDITDAAYFAGYRRREEFSRAENGHKPMPTWRWKYFLHEAGIQPMPFRGRNYRPDLSETVKSVPGWITSEPAQRPRQRQRP